MPINFRIFALVPVGMVVESVAQLDNSIFVTARAGIQVASCPLCGSPSRRVHSWYVREVSDLPCLSGAFLGRARWALSARK